MSSETVLPEMTSGRPAGADASVTKGQSSRRIVVVFVIDNMRLGGTELNAVRTAERLDREKFELRVVCLGEDGPLTQRYRAIGVPVVNMPIRSFYGWSMLRSGLRFVRYVRDARADVVHAHDVYSNIFVAVWARVAGVRVVIASRRWWHSLPNWKLRIGNRFAFARADAVLANSQQVASSVTTEANIAQSKVWTVTNFVDAAAFGAPDEEELRRLRLNWNAPPDAVVIGCVARFDPVKNHEGLISAFGQLHARHPEAFLVLIGDGETRATIESKVRNSQLERCVHFAGELHGSSNLHRGFDISVLASLSEGFPNTLVEAMAAGNPVVATAVGGSIDAVKDGETGLLVPPSQVTSLEDALAKLVESPTLRVRLGAGGQRRAAHDFEASAVLTRLERMYDALLEQGRR